MDCPLEVADDTDEGSATEGTDLTERRYRLHAVDKPLLSFVEFVSYYFAEQGPTRADLGPTNHNLSLL